MLCIEDITSNMFNSKHEAFGQKILQKILINSKWEVYGYKVLQNILVDGKCEASG